MMTNSNSSLPLPTENFSFITPPKLADRQEGDRSFLPTANAVTVTGKTDSMSLPETISFIDVDPSNSIATDPGIVPAPGTLAVSLSLLGLLACGAIGLGHLYRKHRKFLRVVETQKLPPIDLLFFIDRSLPSIPKNTQSLHERAFTNASLLAERVRLLDSDRFRERDFLSFVNLKYRIINCADEYRDLDRSIQQLENALKARELYRAIERIESTGQEPRQQEFYRFVTYLLAECPDRELFRGFLREKLEESLSLMVSNQEKSHLLAYFQAIEQMLGNEGDFTLLGLLRYSRSGYLSVLTIVADLLDSMDWQEENLEQTLHRSVREHRKTLARLKPILTLSEPNIPLDTLSEVLQYIVLDRRYRRSFAQFEESIALLGEWYISYQILVGIRQQHPPTEYRQPKDFSVSIPGTELYQKYQNSLAQHSMV